MRISRLLVVLERRVVIALHALPALGFLSISVLFLFVLGWLSLRLRQGGWLEIGWQRPE